MVNHHLPRSPLLWAFFIIVMSEIFKPIVGYEGYFEISSIGRVKGLSYQVDSRGNTVFKGERMLNVYLDSYGYYVVTLTNRGKSHQRRVHQLMAESFLGHKRCGNRMVIDHIDHNKENNTIDNLQVITNRENCSKDRKSESSKYTGVRFKSSRWHSTIKINGKDKHLGCFDTEYEAHLAYQKKLKEITN